MKAHTGPGARAVNPAPLPKVALLWGLDAAGASLAPLRAAQKLGLRLRTVAPAELGCTVAELCGLRARAGHPAAAAPAAAPIPTGGPLPPAPALILCGLPEPERDALLDALRGAGAVIPLKAIVTPTNQGWRFSALLAELTAEHAALHTGGEG